MLADYLPDYYKERFDICFIGDDGLKTPERTRQDLLAIYYHPETAVRWLKLAFLLEDLGERNPSRSLETIKEMDELAEIPFATDTARFAYYTTLADLANRALLTGEAYQLEEVAAAVRIESSCKNFDFAQ